MSVKMLQLIKKVKKEKKNIESPLVTLCTTRCGETGVPSPEAWHPHRRGNQLRRRHLPAEDEPAPGVFRSIQPHCSGR